MFELIDLGRLDYRQMLSSQVAEAVVLAILGNFNQESPEQVLRSVLERLQQVAKGVLSLEKYLRQLNVLSGLRKLHELTVKTTEAMPITYDIETDFLYKKGLEKGLENKERIFVTRAWEKGLSPEEIAELADMPLERVREIIAELEKADEEDGTG